MALAETVFRAVSSDGAPIGCVVDGAGPPLLMVHGTGDTHLGWRRMRGLLRERFTLYLMDRRGRGISGDRADYALEREWDDVAAVVEAIGEPVNLFGHSFGAMCALEGALRTDRVRRLALYEPSVNRNVGNPRREAAIDEMCRLIAAGDRDAVVATHLKGIINVSDELLAKQRAQPKSWALRLGMAHTMPRELAALRAYRFAPERFATISALTCLLMGEASAPHARQTMQELADSLPNARRVVLPGQGHFAMLTAPSLLAEELVAFFAGR